MISTIILKWSPI